MTHVLQVEGARIAILKSMPPQWSIKADGVVATAGWTNPRLEPRFYINFPEDGIQDFDFVADPPPGISNQVISPVTAYVNWPNPPENVKGVRIHGMYNSVEAFASGAKELGVSPEVTKTGETYAQCVARVKKEYPVPPGNVNTQKQLIELECGTP